ncbi:IS21 family transposase, partial [Streptococcus agalactiae]|nr:IS21 family transposase [Streptococcus agalactiae]
TTNCFKGNEKGHVEESVKIIRKSVFALKYEFKSLDEAKEYLEEKLIEINKNSKIEEEKKKLLILRPKYELAKITRQKVDSYGFVQVANNKYSVYDYLVGKIVTIRTYAEEVKIYYEDNLIASHKKKDGAGETSIDIRHYLDSLARKPGAIRNSLALKEVPVLKTIFDN